MGLNSCFKRIPLTYLCSRVATTDEAKIRQDYLRFFMRLTNLPEAPRPPPVPPPPPWTFPQPPPPPPRDPHFGVAATDDPYQVVEDVESEYDDENLQQHLLESETKEEAEEDKVAEYDDYQDVCSPTSNHSTSSKSSKSSKSRRRSGSRSRSPRRRRRRRTTSSSSCDLDELIGSLEKLARRRRR